MPDFKLPDLGEGMTEAEIDKWLVEEGQPIAEDDPLVEVITDKATAEIPSPFAGVVAQIHVRPGEVVPVGTVLVTIADEAAAAPRAGRSAEPERQSAPERGDQVAAATDRNTEPETTAAAGGPAPDAFGAAATTTPDTHATDDVKATPPVRKLARELNVDLANVTGTGPGGRILRSDVEAAAAPPPGTEPSVEEDVAPAEPSDAAATKSEPAAPEPAAPEPAAAEPAAPEPAAPEPAAPEPAAPEPAAPEPAAPEPAAPEPASESAPEREPAEPPSPAAEREPPPPVPPEPAGIVAAPPVPSPEAPRPEAPRPEVRGPESQGPERPAASAPADVPAPPPPPPEVRRPPTTPTGVEAARPAAASEGERRLPLRGVRRIIAERMTTAHQQVPAVTHVEECDVTALEAVRDRANEGRESGVRLTFLPYIVKAVATTLKSHPVLNAMLDEDAGEIVLYDRYDIGVAVDTPVGLMVPVVRAADTLGVEDIATEIERLAAGARDGTLRQDELTRSTFTVTSPGRYGGLLATPIVLHPQSAILGVHRAVERPVVRDGQIVIRKMMNLSITFDHRIMDGVAAARFALDVVQMLENPPEPPAPEA